MPTEDDVWNKISNNEFDLLRGLFIDIEQDLKTTNFDYEFSGSTACTVLIVGNKLIVSNVGDSKAIMVVKKKRDNDSKEVIILSNDHKPEVFDEKERIVRHGGVVEKHSEFGVKKGPFRVWFKDQDYPGLAMSRSVGDLASREIGIISEPGIYYLI